MYSHQQIEKKWQVYWKKNKSFQTRNSHNKKFYVLDMFPYPSGSGLHVGHPVGYTATDIVARYKRLNDYDVLHPIGWDAFGLPAEQYALKTGNHPQEFTVHNLQNFKKQLLSLGFSYDYDKEINTTDPLYYKTTQWIFIQMHKKGLAKIRDTEVNWCEGLGTVLANEEVITLKNGKKVSERGGFLVTKRKMKQWVLKITDYADQLFKDLDLVNWPQSLINLQRNWIRNEDGSLHLQDWIFSRQRYWGEPFPIAYSDDGKIMLIEKLPLKLPHLEKIKPSQTGESPLANAKDWIHFEANGKRYRRETHTMPQWAGSCWYYLAYILKQPDGTYLDIKSQEAKKLFKKWLPVDLYVGGQEHAVLHLLYARFWHKVLYDIGIVPTREPFLKIINQGMIHGPDGHKMSKSRGNVINPNEIIDKYGADALRVYEMFMSPFEDSKVWTDRGINGIRKWLERVFVGVTKVAKIDRNSKLTSAFNNLAMKVTKEIENFKFNVAISHLMVFVNEIYKRRNLTKKELCGFIVMLSLFAPHIAEELLLKCNFKQISDQTWPHFDISKVKIAKKIIAIQVNGKLRGSIKLTGYETKQVIINRAKKISNVKRFLNGQIIKEIYVPNKILNIVIEN